MSNTDDEHMAFTDHARQAVMAAKRKALELGAATILPEHLLYGLTAAPDTMVARQLERMGVTTETMDAKLGKGDMEAGRTRIAFDAFTVRILQRACESDATRTVSTAGLLRALVMDPDVRERFLSGVSVIETSSTTTTMIGATSSTTRGNGNPYVKAHPGLDCIDLTANMSFLLGNACKHVWRHRLMDDPSGELRKAAWYVRRARFQGDEKVSLTYGQLDIIHKLQRRTENHPQEMAFWDALRRGDLRDMETRLTLMAKEHGRKERNKQ